MLSQIIRLRKPSSPLARFRRLGVIYASALFGLTSVSEALAEFDGPFPLHTMQESSHVDHQTAVDAEGNILTVWEHLIDFPDVVVVKARFRSADGELGPVETVSPAGQRVTNSTVVMDGRGTALVVWGLQVGDTYRMQGRFRLRSGVWGPIKRIVDGPGGGRILMSPDGQALFTWSTNEGLQARSFSRNDGPGPVHDITPPYSSYYSAAIDPQGNAVIAWKDINGTRIYVRRLSSDGVLGPSKLIGRGSLSLIAKSVVVDANGNSVIAWRDEDSRLVARRLRSDDSLGPIKVLSNGAALLDLGVDGEGNAFAFWRRFKPEEVLIQMRTYLADGQLGPIQTIARDDLVDVPNAVTLPSGISVVVWQTSGTGGFVRARLRLSDGSLGEIQTFTDIGDDVALTASFTDVFSFTWEDERPDRNQLRGVVGP